MPEMPDDSGGPDAQVRRKGDGSGCGDAIRRSLDLPDASRAQTRCARQMSKMRDDASPGKSVGAGQIRRQSRIDAGGDKAKRETETEILVLRAGKRQAGKSVFSNAYEAVSPVCHKPGHELF